MIRRITFLLALLSASLAIAMIGASTSALGATATLDSCLPTDPLGQSDWVGPTMLDWDFRLTTGCHLTYGVKTTGPWSNWAGTYAYPADIRPGITFTKVSFDVAGGDGSDGGLNQYIQVCAGELYMQNCSDRITADSANVVVPKHYELTPGLHQLPAGANRIYLAGECKVRPNCAPARPLEISNLKVDAQDDSKPTITWLDNYSKTDQFGNESPPVLSRTGWNNGARVLPVHVSDVGSGAKVTFFHINYPDWREDSPDCGSLSDHPIVSIFCQNELDVVHTVNFNTGAGVYPVNSGANSASIWAVDAAGNESNRISFTFKVDTAPPVIRDLKATTVNPLGWQSSKSVKLSWTNFGEELENATQSGVASVTLDIGPATGSASSHDLKTIASPGINSYDGLILPGNGLWKIAAKTKDNAGSNSLSQLVQVGVDSTVLAAPVVKPLPKVGAAQLAAGVNLSWSKPINVGDSPSGICNYTMSVDHAPHSDPGSGGGIDASATGAKLPAFLESGANYLHLRAVNCAGVPGQIADVPFQVASVAPTIELSSPNQSGWFTTAHPLHATIVDPDDQGVELASTIDGIVGPDAAGPELDIPLDEGEHTVVVTGTDSVGNSSTRVTLARSDLAPPTVKFDAFDPAHPTRVGATVTDASSGVQDAQLQYRSATGGSWQMLGPFVRASGGSQAKLELSANFPDTELDPGIYDLSLVTYDAAGLRTDEGKRIDGSPATLRLPLRSQPSLTANFVSEVATKKCKRTTLKQKLCSTGKLLRKQVASQSTTVDYGQTATVSGSLHDASGEPVANAPLDVFEDAIGSGRRKVDTISTNDVGKFSYATDQGPSRAISVRFGGTDTQLPDQASVDFLVRSQLTLSLNPRHVHGGSTVTFTGHLNAAGAAFPRSGKEIKFQQFRDGKWKLFPLEAVAGPDGNFRADYATGKVKSPLLFKLRAKAPGADGWAYEAGFSSAVNLEVRR